MKTVVAVLPSLEEAKHVAHHLDEMGVAPRNVSIVGPEASEHELKQVERAKRTNGEAFVRGGIKGAVFCGLIGWGLLSVPGVGPFLNGDYFATLAAACAIGIVAGGLIGLLGNMGHSHEEVPLFEEAKREHGTVVAAHLEEEQEGRALEMFKEHSARAVRAAEDAWRASGWTGSYHNEHPDPCDSTLTAH